MNQSVTTRHLIKEKGRHYLCRTIYLVAHAKTMVNKQTDGDEERKLYDKNLINK